jgi:hypothetical protein
VSGTSLAGLRCGSRGSRGTWESSGSTSFISRRCADSLRIALRIPDSVLVWVNTTRTP